MDEHSSTSLTSRKILILSAYSGEGNSGQNIATNRLVKVLQAGGLFVEQHILPARKRGLRLADEIFSLIPRFLTRSFRFFRSLIDSKFERKVIVTALGQSYASFAREGILSILGGWATNSPIVFSLHSTYFLNWTRSTSVSNKIKSLCFVALLKRAEFIVVLGPESGKWLEQRISSAVFQIDNLGEVPPVTNEEVRAKQSNHSSRVKVLYFSSLFESKGYLDFLSALEGLDKESTDRFEVELCGDIIPNPFDKRRKSHDELVSALENRLKILNNSGCIVRWRAKPTESERDQLFRSSQIFVLPSYTEAQPLVLINALLSGCAVITTPVGEIPSVIHSNNGLIFDPGDIEALKANLRILINNKDLRAKLAVSGNEEALKRFSEVKVRERWTSLLSAL